MASTQSVSKDDPVVSVDWLNAKLKDPNMKVIDSSPLYRSKYFYI